MIRFIFAMLWVILFLIVSLPILLVEWIIGWFNPDARAVSSQAIVSFAFRGVTFLTGTDITYKGLENVPNEPVLFTPNHRSIFDIVITYPVFKGPTAFIAKKEIRKVPIFSSWMAFMNCQFLDRKDLREGLKVILKAADLVNAGKNVCVFPEGTRNKGTEDLQEFRDGCLKISEKTGCPIVPVSISNTEQIFEAHFPRVKRVKVVVEFCKPIEVKGLNHKEFHEVSGKVKEEILEAYRANKALVQ